MKIFGDLPKVLDSDMWCSNDPVQYTIGRRCWEVGFTARTPASSIFHLLTVNFDIRILVFRSTTDRAMWVSNELHRCIATANW